jgi:hypothetical protein
MQGLTAAKKRKSSYNPLYLDQEKHAIFLKYRPEKYNSMANNNKSARRHDLLSLRIKDIVFKMLSNRQAICKGGFSRM